MQVYSIQKDEGMMYYPVDNRTAHKMRVLFGSYVITQMQYEDLKLIKMPIAVVNDKGQMFDIKDAYFRGV